MATLAINIHLLLFFSCHGSILLKFAADCLAEVFEVARAVEFIKLSPHTVYVGFHTYNWRWNSHWDRQPLP